MTLRLYYDDAYLTEFDARVTACVPAGSEFDIRLDRSAFYPTSGGQPFDTGFIDSARVLDVQVVDGDVMHLTDQALEIGAEVHCKIDWTRRFDHMQQHAADHMIAGTIWRMFGGVTIGLHESDEVSTIDVSMPDGRTHLTPDEIARVENHVNDQIQRDVPIRCWFPSAEELETLPLRKKPTVSEHIRVVAIGDEEMVACGGTHPSSAGQLGLVKIVSVAPARGKMRIGFIAGGRALRDYAVCYRSAHAAAELFSTRVENLESSVRTLQDRLREAESELSTLREESLMRSLEAELSDAPVVCGGKMIARFVNADAQIMRACASALIKNSGVIALLGILNGERATYVFARSADVDCDMGALLRAAAVSLGGKGGGKPDYAQGGGPKAVLDRAKELILEK